MPGGEPPLTDAARAELTADLIDKLMERDRLSREIQDLAARLDEDNRLRRGPQPGTLRPHPPRPPEPGDDGT